MNCPVQVISIERLELVNDLTKILLFPFLFFRHKGHNLEFLPVFLFFNRGLILPSPRSCSFVGLFFGPAGLPRFWVAHIIFTAWNFSFVLNCYYVFWSWFPHPACLHAYCFWYNNSWYTKVIYIYSCSGFRRCIFIFFWNLLCHIVLENCNQFQNWTPISSWRIGL